SGMGARRRKFAFLISPISWHSSYPPPEIASRCVATLAAHLAKAMSEWSMGDSVTERKGIDQFRVSTSVILVFIALLIRGGASSGGGTCQQNACVQGYSPASESSGSPFGTQIVTVKYFRHPHHR